MNRNKKTIVPDAKNSDCCKSTLSKRETREREVDQGYANMGHKCRTKKRPCSDEKIQNEKHTAATANDPQEGIEGKREEKDKYRLAHMKNENRESAGRKALKNALAANAKRPRGRIKE